MIPLRTKGSQEVANAFLANVLAHFSAPAEVVSDGGTEFQGAFAALLEQCFIDHRVTSPNHPQANGTRHVFEALLNPDQEPHQADELLRLRADAVQRAAPAVGSNRLIAQHRDQHRYARVRAGGYKPRFTNFTVGDYVYVMLRNRNNTLQLPARETILRIVDSSLLSFPTVRVTPRRQGPRRRPRP
ncbi:hypothetical protein GPECTOR_3g455 [Gonium pectorale]|uniref:Integrase catalytic domain-containing protein n=1 Tax=Gonium pectorale TaxID=33097 RepID=A0A150H014_GONPE|nr:hypothetical protein GPECTOR_3g455 [Gonium pectorale]|eukprot:KXZ55322.1 hypothetical protein GPECTOR_3g455 [Gonium pectorale]